MKKQKYQEIRSKYRQGEMVRLLKNKWDCVGKLDACNFLKSYYQDANIREMLNAYNIAYEL